MGKKYSVLYNGIFQYKNRIYIGDEYDRWMEIKIDLRLETNSEVAKILLDR
jgi:hypothetical protein